VVFSVGRIEDKAFAENIDGGSASVYNGGHNATQLTVGLFQSIQGTTAPTAAATGIGSTGTATIESGGTDPACIIRLTSSGSGIASSGSVTLTFGSAFGAGNAVVPSIQPINLTGTWNARASFIGTTVSQTQLIFNWDNNSSALSSGSAYQIGVKVVGY
jgi:hypothetical protein